MRSKRISASGQTPGTNGAGYIINATADIGDDHRRCCVNFLYVISA